MESISNQFIVLGYSGHAFVVLDAAELNNFTCLGYLEQQAKSLNPFDLKYLGTETDSALLKNFKIKGIPMFSAIGDNMIRAKTLEYLVSERMELITIIHPAAVISENSKIDKATYVGARAVINPMAKIGTGVILNTGSIIEHECEIDDFVHIAPGAVLCGNVRIGKGTFIGAGSVVREGVSIGNNVILGAGSVVVKDISDNKKYFGNPAKESNGR